MRTEIHHPAAPRPPVSVNGVCLAPSDIAREAQHHAGASAQEAWAEATRALVIRELLLQRARALGVVGEPMTQDGLRETEDEAVIRALLEREVRTPKAGEATCRRYYDTHRQRFRSPDLFEPAHILFRAARDDTAAYAIAVERAEAALRQVLADPACFGALARTLSDCPSAEDGGRLGQVARGETTPEFEAALLTLGAGETCREPVRTRYGVHVLRLDRRSDGATLPFERVHERIAAYLEDRVWRRAVAQYVSLLAGAADIAGHAMPGAASPLLQ
jgi:peptidyl-prolyl cis-trans isomerase C